MDWRNRKYYQVNPVYSYHDCIKRLKKINSVKISPPFRVSGGILFPKFTLGFNTDKETLKVLVMDGYGVLIIYVVNQEFYRKEQ